MPMRTFWMMHRNIDRLMAESDLRMLSVIAYGQSGEGIEQFSQDMRRQMGRVVEFDEVKRALSEELDSEGLSTLKNLGKAS